MLQELADEPVAQGGNACYVGREVLARLLERRCHADDAGEVLGACPLAALLGAAGDERRDGKTLAQVQGANAARPMKLVAGE